MEKKIASDEINMLEIFLTIMNNKTKVVLIVILTMAIAFSFHTIKSNKNKLKKFTTKVSAISMLDEAAQYQNIKLNIDSSMIDLNSKTLFNLFTEVLKERIVGLVEKSNIIKKKDYQDEEAYAVALNEIISTIKIVDKDQKPSEVFIEFLSYDKDMINKWGDFLSTLEYSINKTTQIFLQDLINKKIYNAKLDKKIIIEDIERAIKANIKNYTLEINNHLAFLREQAEVAREANIENEVVNLSSLGAINTNNNGDLLSLYYLKGYRVIEKEIELIEKRKDPYLFSKDIQDLESRKIKIRSNQSIIREEAKFKATPIFNDDKFVAGLMDDASVSVEELGNYNTSMNAMLIIASLIGLIIAVFYVLISSAIHNAMKHNPKK
tara:strand:+ start:184 stop:1320 length:1137 start_codon:yes stop_codon:yes gene_type:complete